MSCLNNCVLCGTAVIDDYLCSKCKNDSKLAERIKQRVQFVEHEYIRIHKLLSILKPLEEQLCKGEK
jgi:hypothetical protein